MKTVEHTNKGIFSFLYGDLKPCHFCGKQPKEECYPTLFVIKCCVVNIADDGHYSEHARQLMAQGNKTIKIGEGAKSDLRGIERAYKKWNTRPETGTHEFVCETVPTDSEGAEDERELLTIKK